jgi:hypothetical protein
MKALKTPLEHLRNEDLIHYSVMSSDLNIFSRSIPRAINFYYDYKEMNLLQRILFSFKNK